MGLNESSNNEIMEDAGEYAEDFVNIINRIPENCGKWISCRKGWYQLIVDTNNKMKFMCPDYEIYQIKEKFGTLRFYWGIPRDSAWFKSKNEDELQLIRSIMTDIERSAESSSVSKCEFCGDRGQIRTGRWVKTLCKACAQENNYELEEWEK